MKYRIEYEEQTEIEKMFGVEDDYAYGVADLKNILSNTTHKVKRITKDYADGSGVDVTSKYIKSIDLYDIVCR